MEGDEPQKFRNSSSTFLRKGSAGEANSLSNNCSGKPLDVSACNIVCSTTRLTFNEVDVCTSVLLAALEIADNPSDILGCWHKEIHCFEAWLRLAVGSDRFDHCRPRKKDTIGMVVTAMPITSKRMLGRGG